MLDWLMRSPRETPSIEIAGQVLPIVVRRLAQARRMTLRLAPDGSEVRLSIPRWGRTAEAVAFARARRDWLESQLAALPRAQAPAPDGTLTYRGAVLRIAHDPARRRKPELAERTIIIGGPAESLPARLKRWLEGEARAVMTEDLTHYCALAGKPVRKLALTSAQRRWGSCGPDGAIRINWRLIMAPDFVRRSVVAHEVAHLVHFDHSPRFHALLDELFEGSIDEANAWLKREGRKLYAAFG
ncbi:MAG: M48 family peptidase [Novosphingobium sp.]|nr:MAG: M48 family peptidase [Novosphingobium sp.]